MGEKEEEISTVSFGLTVSWKEQFARILQSAGKI
jgi:hypothetical protein